MKTIVAAALILISTSVMAAPPDFIPPGHRYDRHNGNSSSSASATANSTNTNLNVNQNAAVGIGGEGGKAVAIAPTTIAPVQAVTVNSGAPSQSVTVNTGTPATPTATAVVNTPAPVVQVQEAPKVIPYGLPVNQQNYIPSVQPGSLDAAQPMGTMGAPSIGTLRIPGGNVSLWKTDGTRFDIADIEDGEINKDIEIIYTPVKTTTETAMRARKPDGRMTVHKPTEATMRGIAPEQRELIGVGIAKANRAGMTYAQIEVAIMQFAKQKGAIGITELDRYATSVTNSKGWNVGAQIGASVVGSLNGQGAVYGPLVSAMYQSLTANVEDRKWVEFELER